MSTLRFESEYLSGALFTENLVATPVTASASLTIGITRAGTLPATISESASLIKSGIKPLNCTIRESPTFHLKRITRLPATVSESALLMRHATKAPAATVTMSSQIALGQLYPLQLNATISAAASLSVRESYGINLVSDPVSISVLLTQQRAFALVAAPIGISATNTRRQVVTHRLTATPILETVLAVTLAKAGVITATPVRIVTVPVTGIKTIHFNVVVQEIATINKRGRYPQPAQVLQLYDTDNPYVLPILQGATTSYVNGILGSGVSFDIYGALVLAAFGISYRDLIVAHQPVAFWQLSELVGTVAVDETGNNPGTYIGGYLLGQDGALSIDPSETSVRFDGNTGFVAIPDSPELNFTNMYTLEAWVNIFDASKSGAIIAHGKASRNWALTFNTARKLVLWVDSLHSAVSGTAVVLNRWTHVAASFDGVNVRFYINGVKEGTHAVTYDPTKQYVLSNDVSIASAQDDTNSTVLDSNPLGALIDEVSAYNYPLTDSMILAHYAVGSHNPPAGVNSQFYVCDNGLKEALDRHPAVVRIQ